MAYGSSLHTMSRRRSFTAGEREITRQLLTWKPGPILKYSYNYWSVYNLGALLYSWGAPLAEYPISKPEAHKLRPKNTPDLQRAGQSSEKGFCIRLPKALSNRPPPTPAYGMTVSSL